MTVIADLLASGEPQALLSEGGRGCVTAWLPDGHAEANAPVLWLLGGAMSTHISILGRGGAETLTARTIRSLVGDGVLPHGTFVIAIGAVDGYSAPWVTTPELAYEDLGRAAASAAKLAREAERLVLGRDGNGWRRVVCGASYGGTVAARLLVTSPRVAKSWCILSGLPQNRACFAEADPEAEAIVLGSMLGLDKGARVVLATGDDEPTHDGMVALHKVLARIWPENAGRTRLIVRRGGTHDPTDFCHELDEALVALRDMRKDDDGRGWF